MIAYLTHDKTAARKAVEPGKLPLLAFQSGDKKVLLPNGQMVNQQRYVRGPLPVTGKQARRQRIARQRLQREDAAQGEP